MLGWGNMMGNWGNSGYSYGCGYGWMGMMGTMGTILPLIFVTGVILLCIYFYRRKFSGVYSNRSEKQTTGLDILRERYARGEIDSVEFQSKKHDLEISE